MPVPEIKSVVRREETLRRFDVVGDDFPMTWAADDRQYAAMQDGTAWMDPDAQYNSRLLAVSGGPEEAAFEDVPGYPDLIDVVGVERQRARYYGFTTLALDGCFYQYLSTLDRPFNLADWSQPSHWFGAKLIYSDDSGVTWRNQDGSTPVVWETWDERSRENMVFFDEPGEAFSTLAILQMGRNYEHNRDGYVYVYGPNGNVDGVMNELVMYRVPKDRILDRSAYEFFAGRRPDGGADWSGDIEARSPVCTFPRGWVNTRGPLVVESWVPSVVYNAPLDQYLMTAWGQGCGDDGSWFGAPSYLGFWVADTPWGPWSQIHEETAWLPGGDSAARAYMPGIPPKWIAADGESFWLVWTDYQGGEALFNRATTAEEIAQLRPRNFYKSFMPYYGINAQRVDLVVAGRR